MANGAARTRIFSAIQPTGALTLGNYLGAIKGWVELQRTSNHDVLFCVADYHAITVRHEPAELRASTLALVLELIGCGLDPSRSVFQILAETAPAAELRRLERAREEGSLRYAEPKEAVTTHLLAALAPLRQRRASLVESFALAALVDGAARAGAIAHATLAEVRDRIGILDPARSR